MAFYTQSAPSASKASLPPQSKSTSSGKEVAIFSQVECTYLDCNLRFATVKEMQRHKKYASEHDYCRRCDVDCKDWDDLLKHKVDAMTLYLYDDAYRASEVGRLGPKHIVCEFCGADFATFGGRDLHRLHMHKAAQDVKCPGCDEDFPRACELVHHLEAGECPKISQIHFERAVMTKHILKQIMENPAEFQEHMSHNRGVLERSFPPARLLDAASVEHSQHVESTDGQSSDGGGVALCGPDRVDLLSDVPYPQSPTKIWPQNLRESSDYWSESMRGMSLNSPVDGKTSFVSQGDIKTANSHYLDAFPALGCPSKRSSSAFAAESERRDTSEAWENSSTSLSHFTNNKSDSALQTLALRYDNAIDKFDETSNLLYDRFWDANTQDFNAEMFFNMVIEKYCCPFPGCRSAQKGEYQDCGSAFLTAADLRAHLQSFHVTMRWQCPGTTCLKIFKSATALVAHTEMSNKCHARKSQGYQAALDEITGGFLAAKRVALQQVVDTSQSLVLSGIPADGVADVQYTTKAPDHFRD